MCMCRCVCVHNGVLQNSKFSLHRQFNFMRACRTYTHGAKMVYCAVNRTTICPVKWMEKFLCTEFTFWLCKKKTRKRENKIQRQKNAFRISWCFSYVIHKREMEPHKWKHMYIKLIDFFFLFWNWMPGVY